MKGEIKQTFANVEKNIDALDRNRKTDKDKDAQAIQKQIAKITTNPKKHMCSYDLDNGG